MEVHGVTDRKRAEKQEEELKELDRAYNQLVMERDNLVDQGKQQAIQVQNESAKYVLEIQRLKEALKNQEPRYLEEHKIRVQRAEETGMVSSIVDGSDFGEYSPIPQRYQMSPSQVYGPFVAERRMLFEEEKKVNNWIAKPVTPTPGLQPRATPPKPPKINIKVTSPGPKKR